MSTRKKILLIDDDTRNIFALSAVLKASAYECISKSSAKEGLDLLRTDPAIGVVLMDMMMPEMDGYQAIADIRSDENLDDVYVIAVTAQAMLGDREKCLAAGADEYISKPIDFDMLNTLLDKYLK